MRSLDGEVEPPGSAVSNLLRAFARYLPQKAIVEGHTVALPLAGPIICPAIGRPHASNRVHLVVNTRDCTARLHCMDMSDCGRPIWRFTEWNLEAILYPDRVRERLAALVPSPPA